MLHVSLCLFVGRGCLGWRGRRRVVPPRLIRITIGCVLWGASIGIVSSRCLLGRLGIAIAIVTVLLAVGIVVCWTRGRVVGVVVRSMVAPSHAAFWIGRGDVER